MAVKGGRVLKGRLGFWGLWIMILGFGVWHSKALLGLGTYVS